MKIFFNEKDSTYWSAKYDANSHFLVVQETYLMERFKHRGYIYLNEVYEALGVAWDPLKENVCWIKGADEFSIAYHEDIFGNWLITVH